MGCGRIRLLGRRRLILPDHSCHTHTGGRGLGVAAWSAVPSAGSAASDAGADWAAEPGADAESAAGWDSGTGVSSGGAEDAAWLPLSAGWDWLPVAGLLSAASWGSW